MISPTRVFQPNGYLENSAGAGTRVDRLPFVNGGETQVKGLDLDVLYIARLGDMGRLRNRVNATYFHSWKGNTADGDPLIEYVSYRIPRTRAAATTEWEYRAWTVGATVNYTRGYHVSFDPRVSCRSASLLGTAGVCEVGARTSVDLALQWRGIKNLTLLGTVQNLFDKNPALDPLSRPFNYTYTGSLYRSVYLTLGATYKFR